MNFNDIEKLVKKRKDLKECISSEKDSLENLEYNLYDIEQYHDPDFGNVSLEVLNRKNVILAIIDAYKELREVKIKELKVLEDKLADMEKIEFTEVK